MDDFNNELLIKFFRKFFIFLRFIGPLKNFPCNSAVLPSSYVSPIAPVQGLLESAVLNKMPAEIIYFRS